MAHSTRVLVIEDHPLFRDALAMRIGETLPGAEIAYSGSSIREATTAHAQQRTDCAILDLDLGDGRSSVLNTTDLVDAGCRVLIVSALADPATVRSALQAGALGFVSKQASVDEFQQALEATIAGEPYTSSDVAAILASGGAPSVSLTEREQTALVMYASGMKIESVARRMGVKPSTAQEYIKRVRAKYLKAGTPVPTKTELYIRAREDGLVP